MANRRYRIAVIVCFTISSILQIVSIVSPGWVVDIQGNTEVYTSMFYTVTCTTKDSKTDCPAKAYHKLYNEARWLLDYADAGPIPYITLDKQMYDDVQEMLFLLVALFCTIAAFITQMVRTRIGDKYYRIATVVSPVVIALADGLMLSIISRYIINNRYLTQLRDIDARLENVYAGFPYSLALYVVAFIANTIAVVVNTCQSIGSMKKLRRNRRDDD